MEFMVSMSVQMITHKSLMRGYSSSECSSQMLQLLPTKGKRKSYVWSDLWAGTRLTGSICWHFGWSNGGNSHGVIRALLLDCWRLASDNAQSAHQKFRRAAVDIRHYELLWRIYGKSDIRLHGVIMDCLNGLRIVLYIVVLCNIVLSLVGFIGRQLKICDFVFVSVSISKPLPSLLRALKADTGRDEVHPILYWGSSPDSAIQPWKLGPNRSDASCNAAMNESTNSSVA